MTFVGSARKWRPQRFDELIGQEHIRRTFTNALAVGRVASAYLFSGTRGVGKTTTARILAKSLNCESTEGPAPEPCNQCSSCEEIMRDAHPDVLEIDGATYTGVDNVRELREGLRYRPARGRYKVVIIDEVHMLSRGAFNALLKTLEEPPPHVVFIFATTELQKVPETILSRCQVFEFRRIPTQVIAAQLARIVEEQGRKADDGALRLLARMGEGSMRDAQSLLDQVLAFSASDILMSKEVEEVLGVPSSEVYVRLISAISERDGCSALRELKGVFEAGHDLRLFCGNLLECLRDLMVLHVAGEDEELFDVSHSELEVRKHLSTRLPFAEAHQAYAILQDAELELRGSEHPRMTLELALMRMCQIEPIVELGELIERLESLAQGTEPGQSSIIPRTRPQAKEPSRPVAPAVSSEPMGSLAPSGRNVPRSGTTQAGAAPEITMSTQTLAAPWDPKEVLRVWQEAVESLRETRKFLLHGADVDPQTEGVVRVRVLSDNGSAQLLHMLEETLPAVEDYFRANSPWTPRVVLEVSGGGKKLGSAPSPRVSAKARRVPIKDEEQAIIQEVVDLFNGQIVDIRPSQGRPSPGSDVVTESEDEFQGDD